jgi:hypothetical protein
MSAENTATTIHRVESSRVDPAPRRFLSRVYQANAVIGLAGLIVSSLLGSGELAASFGSGALLSMGAVFSTERFVRRCLVPTGKPGHNRIRLLALMTAKIPALAVILYLITRSEWFHPVGFTLGLGVMPVVLTFCGVFWLMSSKTDLIGP